MHEPQLGQKPSNAPALSSQYPTYVHHFEDFREGYASIEVTIRELPFERQFRTYRWVGPPTAPVRIFREMLGYPWPKTDDELLARLPWKLRRLPGSYHVLAGTHDYVRVDGGLWLAGWLTALRHRLHYHWRWFSVHVVLTLYVWGMAYTEPGAEPRWADVRWPWRKR